jgi:hypothetical protein
MADPNETTNLVNEITGTGGAHAADEGGLSGLRPSSAKTTFRITAR